MDARAQFAALKKGKVGKGKTDQGKADKKRKWDKKNYLVIPKLLAFERALISKTTLGEEKDTKDHTKKVQVEITYPFENVDDVNAQKVWVKIPSLEDGDSVEFPGGNASGQTQPENLCNIMFFHNVWLSGFN